MDGRTERLLESSHHVDGDRRPADVRDPQRRQRLRARGCFAERDAHRRYAEHDARSSARHRLERGLRLEALHHRYAPADEKRADEHLLTEHVREGRDAEQHVGGREAEGVRAEACGCADSGVRQDRALRPAGGAGGEEERSRIVLVPFGDLDVRLAVARERTIDARPRRRRLEPRVDLGLRQQDVERHRHRSEAENAEVRGHVVGRVRQLDRDAVVGLDALRAQRCGRDGGPTVELAVRDPLALEQQRRPLGMLSGAVREDVGEVHERRSRRATSVCGARIATSSS